MSQNNKKQVSFNLLSKDNISKFQNNFERLKTFVYSFYIDDDLTVQPHDEGYFGDCCTCTWSDDTINWLKKYFDIDCEILDACQCKPEEWEIEDMLDKYAKTNKFEYDGDLKFQFGEKSWKMFQPTYFDIIQELTKYIDTEKYIGPKKYDSLELKSNDDIILWYNLKVKLKNGIIVFNF